MREQTVAKKTSRKTIKKPAIRYLVYNANIAPNYTVIMGMQKCHKYREVKRPL
jgi:hypothetical protein